MTGKTPIVSTVVLQLVSVPDIQFLAKLPPVAAELQKLIPKRDQWTWSNNGNSITFRPTDRHLIATAFNGMLTSSLSVEDWRANVGLTTEMVSFFFKEMKTSEMKRLSFRVRSWFDLGMSHAETCDAFFGSFLPPRKQLEDVASDLYDLSLQFHGQTQTDKFELNITPQTVEQGQIAVTAFEGVDAFGDPPTRSTPITSMIAGIKTPSLFIDCMLHLSDVGVAHISPFLSRCATATLGIRDKALSKLLNY